MEFQQRLYQLRRERGMSQENMAEVVGVTRQAVQKWESGASRPDMDNLTALAGYFGVTLDWLITGEEPAAPPAGEGQTVINNYYDGNREYEYISERTLWGLPLVHIHLKNNSLVRARGIIAIGNVAVGVVSVGVFSCGLASLGVLSAGALVSIGCLSLGTLSVGCVAAGLVGIGAFAWGWLALGGICKGVYAAGGIASASRIAIGGVTDGALSIGYAARGDTVIQLTEGQPVPPETREAILRAIAERTQGWLRALLEGIAPK